MQQFLRLWTSYQSKISSFRRRITSLLFEYFKIIHNFLETDTFQGKISWWISLNTSVNLSKVRCLLTKLVQEHSPTTWLTHFSIWNSNFEYSKSNYNVFQLFHSKIIWKLNTHATKELTQYELVPQKITSWGHQLKSPENHQKITSWGDFPY